MQGAHFSTEVILVLGIASLVADSISMGFGDYLSERAELDFASAEFDREKWEFDNFEEGEIQEMIDIYQEKGFSPDDAENIIRCMAKNRQFFVEHMMVQELKINPPTGDEQPIKSGVTTAISFICFGVVPLLSYVIFKDVEFAHYDPKFAISIFLTLFTLFLLGFVKALMTGTNNIRSGFCVMLNGAIAAAASYVIGMSLSELTKVHGC